MVPNLVSWLGSLKERINMVKGKGELRWVSASRCLERHSRQMVTYITIWLLAVITFIFPRSTEFQSIRLQAVSWTHDGKAIILSKGYETNMAVEDKNVSSCTFAVVAKTFFIQHCNLERKASKEMDRLLLERRNDTMPKGKNILVYSHSIWVYRQSQHMPFNKAKA